jgi:hypothetical protein
LYYNYLKKSNKGPSGITATDFIGNNAEETVLSNDSLSKRFLETFVGLLNVSWHQNILRYGTSVTIGFREDLSIAQFFAFLVPACSG